MNPELGTAVSSQKDDVNVLPIRFKIRFLVVLPPENKVSNL